MSGGTEINGADGSDLRTPASRHPETPPLSDAARLSGEPEIVTNQPMPTVNAGKPGTVLGASTSGLAMAVDCPCCRHDGAGIAKIVVKLSVNAVAVNPQTVKAGVLP